MFKEAILICGPPAVAGVLLMGCQGRPDAFSNEKMVAVPHIGWKDVTCHLQTGEIKMAANRYLRGGSAPKSVVDRLNDGTFWTETILIQRLEDGRIEILPRPTIGPPQYTLAKGDRLCFLDRY